MGDKETSVVGLHPASPEAAALAQGVERFTRATEFFRGVLPLDEYPPVRTAAEAARFLDFVALLERARRYFVQKPSAWLRESPGAVGLFLSVTSFCPKGCRDCISGSDTAGRHVPFDNLTGLSDGFCRTVRKIMFGMEGEPLLYDQGGRNFGDVIAHYLDRGISHFTLSTGCPPRTRVVSEALDRLGSLSGRQPWRFYPRLTYSFYPVLADPRRLAQHDGDFIWLLKTLLPLSTRLLVLIRGDLAHRETDMVKTVDHFNDVMAKNGFRGRELSHRSLTYLAEDGRPIEVSLQAGIYPCKRLRESEAAGLLTLSGPEKPLPEDNGRICSHLFRYDRFAIMARGDVRTCTAMPSYEQPRNIVENIYGPNGETEFLEALDRHHEACWQSFSANIREIMHGRKTTCLCRTPRLAVP